MINEQKICPKEGHKGNFLTSSSSGKSQTNAGVKE